MNKILLLGLSSCFAVSASAVTIVSSVSDLDFVYSGGASEASSSAGSLGIQTSKNSDAVASLPSAYQLAVGETMTATFNMQMDANFADISSYFTFGFGSGTNTYSVRLNPNDSGTSVILFESDAGNITPKRSQDATFGTNNNEFSFTVTRSAASEITLTFESAQLAGSPGVSVSTTSTVYDTFDSFFVAYSGNGWNEDLGSGTAITTFTDMTIDTTGTAIPEPSTYAMLVGASVLVLGIMRRRK